MRKFIENLLEFVFGYGYPLAVLAIACGYGWFVFWLYPHLYAWLRTL